MTANIDFVSMRHIMTPSDDIKIAGNMASLNAFNRDGSSLWRIDGGMPLSIASEILKRCVGETKIRIFDSAAGGTRASIVGFATLDRVEELVALCERHNRELPH